MSTTNQIIVYRNRSEAEIDRMIWEGDGTVQAVFLYLVCFIACVVFINYLIDKTELRYSKHKNKVLIGSSIPLAYGVLKFLGWFILWI